MLGAELTGISELRDVPGECFLFIYFFIHEKELELSDSPHSQTFPPTEEVLNLALGSQLQMIPEVCRLLLGCLSPSNMAGC